MSEKLVTTIQKLDGSKTEVAVTAGEDLKTILQRAKEYQPDKYSYMLSGPNIEGGQKQIDENLLSEVRVESMEQVLIIPKTIAGC